MRNSRTASRSCWNWSRITSRRIRPRTRRPDGFGLPDGNTILLTEYEVVALVNHLLEPQVAVWSENPSPTAPGNYQTLAFRQPGMVSITESGQAQNGEMLWAPEYFNSSPSSAFRMVLLRFRRTPRGADDR